MIMIIKFYLRIEMKRGRAFYGRGIVTNAYEPPKKTSGCCVDGVLQG